MQNDNQTAKNLPTIADLYEENLELAFRNDQFNRLMNEQPKPSWIKENPYANNAKYIPIGIIETMLQKIFKRYRIEVLREGTMFNAVYVTVRVHYWNGISNTWDYHDGIGAVQLQTKKGSSPAQMENINNQAVMMALPMAKSYAIKDATDHLGKLFGRDLNRKDTMAFEADQSMSRTQAKGVAGTLDKDLADTWWQTISDCRTEAELLAFKKQNKPTHPDILKMIDTRMAQLQSPK